MNNKDLDLPTQQELLAQFRCDEILREVLVGFDEAIIAFEDKQAEAVRLGASRGHWWTGCRDEWCSLEDPQELRDRSKPVSQGCLPAEEAELESKIDTRLKALFHGQLTAAHKAGVREFSEAVSGAVKAGQKKGGSYDFAEIVTREAKGSLEKFEEDAKLYVGRRCHLEQLQARARSLSEGAGRGQWSAAT